MDEQIDRVLGQGPELPDALAERIRAEIRRDTRPVKPMMSGGVYALLFVLIFGAISLGFATTLGFGGLHVLSPVAAVEILSVLLLLALCSSAMASRSMRPGTGRLYSGALAIGALVGYEALVISLFRDYSTTLFVKHGVACLLLGVACAAVVALPMWLAARRGFIVEPVRAGAVIGLTGGLCGLTALTLHCPVLTTPHAGVWHTLVILVSVLGGMVVGRLAKRRS